MTDFRIIPCEVCGTEGRILRQHVLNPYEEVDCGECPECEGHGTAVVVVEPVACDEEEQAHG